MTDELMPRSFDDVREMLTETIGEARGEPSAAAALVLSRFDVTPKGRASQSSEEWRREAYPDEYPATTFEDREHFRVAVRAALEAARKAGR